VISARVIGPLKLAVFALAGVLVVGMSPSTGARGDVERSRARWLFGVRCMTAGGTPQMDEGGTRSCKPLCYPFAGAGDTICRRMKALPSNYESAIADTAQRDQP
jgi:hypothetical protein